MCGCRRYGASQCILLTMDKQCYSFTAWVLLNGHIIAYTTDILACTNSYALSNSSKWKVCIYVSMNIWKNWMGSLWAPNHVSYQSLIFDQRSTPIVGWCFTSHNIIIRVLIFYHMEVNCYFVGEQRQDRARNLVPPLVYIRLEVTL